MNSGSLVLMMAKKYGVSVRILHSHSARTGDRKWKEIRNKLFCGLSLKFANTYFSCSHLAGDYLFGKDNYYIIPNAINIDRFSFDNKKRLSCRKEENCEEKFIITTVGRFARPKNTMFIVDIIYEMSKFDKDFVFWWFGNGELEQVVKAYAKEKDVEKFIKFWGANPNVNVYYSAADVFILPSLYEGLPVVGIEAQVASLPALFSDRITREVKISDSVEFLPITDAGLWAKSILKYRGFDREKNANGLDLTEYKIEEQAKRLKQLYIKLLKGK